MILFVENLNPFVKKQIIYTITVHTITDKFDLVKRGGDNGNF